VGNICHRAKQTLDLGIIFC
jgi:hypothetical protein